MSESRLSYWDYVKAAFRRRLPVEGLGAMPVNQLLLGLAGVLGLLNPGFWFAGAAAELVYLTWLSSNPRFQRLVDAEQSATAQGSWEEAVRRGLERLEPESRTRYERLLAQCRAVLGLSAAVGGTSLEDLRELKATSLNQLLGIFLRLLTFRELLVGTLERVDRSTLEAEAERLEAQLAELGPDAEEALVRSLTGTLEIERRRLENLERAAISRRIVEAELARIERQVELVREETAVSGRPELLSNRLDAVTSTMSEAAGFLESNAELFHSLSNDDAIPAYGELPNLPEQAPPAPPPRRRERES